MSFGITDIRSPDTKEAILAASQRRPIGIEKSYRMGRHHRFRNAYNALVDT